MIARTSKLLLSCLLLAALSPASAAEPQVNFGAPLRCVEGAPRAVHVVANQTPGFAATADDGIWAARSMWRIGYASKPPASGAARDAAMTASALLRRGNVVAAKMAHDQAVSDVPEYTTGSFSDSFESLLTVLTQPVMHASYPTAVLAEGEVRNADDASHGHTHGVDIEQSSAGLAEIISRASTVQRGLGDLYNRLPVRYYILASGFRDGIALEAAAAGVCAEKLNAAALNRLNIAARFMAMPSQIAGDSK